MHVIFKETVLFALIFVIGIRVSDTCVGLCNSPADWQPSAGKAVALQHSRAAAPGGAALTHQVPPVVSTVVDYVFTSLPRSTLFLGPGFGV